MAKDEQVYAKLKKAFKSVFDEVGKVVVGQDEVIEQILISMVCDANALLEGYPGLAKTMIVRTLSQILDIKFSRIQNTPDLMPSDITGTNIIEETKGERRFRFQQGPIFANIVLADEINRATPKTQSALLEAMQEKQVTVGDKTYKLDKPFFILATQNPIEQEGTYPLPEAQSDRFLLKILTTYPTEEEELKIVEAQTSEAKEPTLSVVLHKDSLLKLQKFVRQVPIANDLKKRAVNIVKETRSRKEKIEYGASPRASIGLVMAAKARALIRGRNYVSNEDLDTVALPVLRHRIILTFEEQRKGTTPDDAIKDILSKVKAK